MRINQDFLLLSGAITVLFLLGIGGGVFYPDLTGWLQSASNQPVLLSTDRSCNPSGRRCTANSAELTLTLELGEHIKPLQSFPIQVDFTGAADRINQVSVSFTMLNMDMGFNRFNLSQHEGKTWQGQAILPVCSMGRRDWRVTVEAFGDHPYSAEFYLLTDF